MAATCEMNTTDVKVSDVAMLTGIKQSNNKVAAQKIIPIKYLLGRLTVRSVNGAHTNRHKLAERPKAVMEAAAAEIPRYTYSNVTLTDAKPALIP
jgi:hypothetical protein